MLIVESMVGIFVYHIILSTFFCLNILIIKCEKKTWLLFYWVCCIGNIVGWKRGGSSSKFLNLEKEMQMHVDPAPDLHTHPLLPQELPSFLPPQGLGVRFSITHLPLHDGAIKRPLSSFPSRGLWITALINFCVWHQNATSCKNPPGLPTPLFPAPRFHQLAVLDLTARFM